MKITMEISVKILTANLYCDGEPKTENTGMAPEYGDDP